MLQRGVSFLLWQQHSGRPYVPRERCRRLSGRFRPAGRFRLVGRFRLMGHFRLAGRFRLAGPFQAAKAVPGCASVRGRCTASITPERMSRLPARATCWGHAP
eukprot:225099-Chlamydomonas_euryale.AAC.1